MKAANQAKRKSEFSGEETVEDKLIKDIEKINKELQYAYEKFDLISEEILIDSQIYHIKAISLRYEYLIQQAKELGIIVKQP